MMRNSTGRLYQKKAILAFTGLSAILLVLCLGGCGEGELFQKHNDDIQSRANYFPDPHPIETTHQNNGAAGMGAMPFGSGGNGF